jgi:hypothetical protein
MQKGFLFHIVTGATLSQMPLEVIQYNLTIVLEGNQYPLAKN